MILCAYVCTLPTVQHRSRSTHVNSLLMSVIYYHRLFVSLFSLVPRHASLDELLITFQQSMAATEVVLRKSAQMRLIVPRGASFFGPPMAPDPSAIC